MKTLVLWLGIEALGRTLEWGSEKVNGSLWCGSQALESKAKEGVVVGTQAGQGHEGFFPEGDLFSLPTEKSETF